MGVEDLLGQGQRPVQLSLDDFKVLDELLVWQGARLVELAHGHVGRPRGVEEACRGHRGRLRPQD